MAPAKEDGLIEDDPFDKVKLGKPADDSEARGDRTKAELKTPSPVPRPVQDGPPLPA